VTGRSVVRRTLDDAASVGARVIVASALGESVGADDLNQVVATQEPTEVVRRDYDALREAADAIASAVINVV